MTRAVKRVGVLELFSLTQLQKIVGQDIKDGSVLELFSLTQLQKLDCQ